MRFSERSSDFKGQSRRLREPAAPERRAKNAQYPEFPILLEVLCEDGRLNVYAGERAVRPPGAPTARDRTGRGDVTGPAIRAPTIPVRFTNQQSCRLVVKSVLPHLRCARRETRWCGPRARAIVDPTRHGRSRRADRDEVHRSPTTVRLAATWRAGPDRLWRQVGCCEEIPYRVTEEFYRGSARKLNQRQGMRRWSTRSVRDGAATLAY